jgi:hypothetical protein
VNLSRWRLFFILQCYQGHTTILACPDFATIECKIDPQQGVVVMRIYKIAAVVVLTVASPALYTRPLSAQSTLINGQLFRYAFQHSLLDGMDGTSKGCRIYSNAAQLQSGDNFRFRCGYTGARWDKNPDIHYWWCRLIHRRASILAELRNREMDLQRCVDWVEFEQPRQYMRASVSATLSQPTSSNSSSAAASASRIYISMP